MNFNYLTVLPRIDQNYSKDYTLIDSSQKGMGAVVEDKINFNNADKNHDDFLTYEELADIKLSVNFNVKKDKFELIRGVDLLDNESIKNIFSQKGISFYTLEEELKKLDRDKDGKIDSDEVEQNLSQLALKQEKAYLAYKLNDVRETEGEETQSQNDKKQIAALEKQIQSLKKMISELETQKASTPISSNTATQEDISSHETESISNQLNIKELEAKYGSENIEKAVNTIERANNINNVADTIIAQIPDMSKEDIVNLAQGMEAIAMGEISVQAAQELSAIEQFSPAASPINIDKKNIDFSIGSVKQKIADLEGMKDKIMQKMMDSQLKKIDTRA